jgi:transcriptional regulator with XRE-family HTH domain
MNGVYSTVGQRIRDERKRAGMTLEDLGAAADLPASFIGQIERNAKKASLSTYSALAAALNLPLSRLFSVKSASRDLPVDRRIELMLRGHTLSERKRLFLIFRAISKHWRAAP